MRLEPLYRIRFTYPEGWAIGLGGDWEQPSTSPRGDVKALSAGASGVQITRVGVVMERFALISGR